MNHLRDLLQHEIQDLYSVEEQIIEAMPAMIGKAKTPQLRQALETHLKITERQKERLDKVKQLMGTESQEGEKRSGLFGMFGGGKQKCIGIEGIIKEGERVMAEDMEPEVLEAAIVASAQKIEHYEICGYGTARAYARELNMGEVAELLEETLDEEYEADDRLTDLAVSRLNEEAKKGMRGGRRNGSGSGNNRAGSGRKTASKSAAGKKSAGKTSSGNKTAGNKGTAKKGATKGSRSSGGSGGRTASKGGRSAAGKKSAGKKAGTKKGGRR